ncbi:hypothetical protein PHLCEN_2v10479 [Hermanssonia centrifuga]|uniref:Uncharacterized protein n=1 Tax=Hermanssonia centrifuga TaxID=98765 RepID=A0A2R6NMI0_9APHY|nr:hypothetical protein PHLCEN_2v10479 [Hermanssonia centrifuga]
MSFLGHLSLRRIATTTPFRAHLSHFRPQIRRFSVSSRRTAEESPKSDIWPALNEFKETKVFAEIQSNKELREALLDAMKVMQEEALENMFV